MQPSPSSVRRRLLQLEQALHPAQFPATAWRKRAVGVCTWTPGVAPLVEYRCSIRTPVVIQITENDEPLPADRWANMIIQSVRTHAHVVTSEKLSAVVLARLRTGGLGLYVDTDGHGRRKNIIKHGGETILAGEQIADGVLAPQ